MICILNYLVLSLVEILGKNQIDEYIRSTTTSWEYEKGPREGRGHICWWSLIF